MSFYTKQTISAYGIAAASYKRRVLDLGIDHGNISTFKSNPSTDFAQIALTEKKLCLESNFIKNDSDWQNLSRSIYDLDDKKLSDKTLICSKAYNNFISSIDEKIINALKKLSGSNFIAAADDYIQRELSKK